jgi:hypothetical protein
LKLIEHFVYPSFVASQYPLEIRGRIEIPNLLIAPQLFSRDIQG